MSQTHFQVAMFVFNTVLLYDYYYIICTKYNTGTYVQRLLKYQLVKIILAYNISCKNTFGVKKVQPSKVESYLEVNT